MKEIIKKLLREGLDDTLTYEEEHLGSVYGQDNYELGLYLNGEIVGLVNYVIFEGELTVSNIIVRPEFRRRGFGSRMMQYVKKIHPEAKYKPSFKTDLGMAFKHKEVPDLNKLDEEVESTEYGVYEIMIPIAYLDTKYYFQASPMHEILSNRVFIKKGSAGNKSISTKNIKVLKSFHLPYEENEMILFLNDLRDNE
jgi:GNAT superfamily N-acetyltransferase